MTDSMIPYSFVPGMKAKAGEVNANFIALAETITQNKISADYDIETINNILDEINNTLDDELFIQKNIVESSTDLDDYKRKGIYFFSSSYEPLNAPISGAGTLVVLGDETSGFKQLWFYDESILRIYTRNYTNSSWTEWNNSFKDVTLGNPGYFKFPNGIIMQWGVYKSPNVTYPVAFATSPAVVVSKQGYSTSSSRSDEGFTNQSGTGFKYYASSNTTDLLINWIAIGH